MKHQLSWIFRPVQEPDGRLRGLLIRNYGETEVGFDK
jgi:hypothetical protein